MRGVYNASINISNNTAAKTLIYITGPANKVVEILSATIGTEGSNVTNQQLEATWQTVSSLGTPTGTSITPAKLETGDQAAGSTVLGNVTASEPTYGANTEVDRQGFASLGGYNHSPVPEERITIAGGETKGLRLLNSMTGADLVVNVRFREIG